MFIRSTPLSSAGWRRGSSTRSRGSIVSSTTIRQSPPARSNGNECRNGLVAKRDLLPVRATGRIAVYGIRNCDSVKKSRQWLADHDLAYVFHDYKVEGIDEARLRRWVAEAGWERLLNRSGTTFRKLPDSSKDALDEEKALALMVAQPSMIKRPVIEDGDQLL